MKEHFIKINFEKAIDSKKEMLNAQLHFVYAREHIKKLVKLKKQDMILKNKIKDDIESVRNKIKYIFSCFPKKRYRQEEVNFNEYHRIIHSNNAVLIKRDTHLEEELLRIKKD